MNLPQLISQETVRRTFAELEKEPPELQPIYRQILLTVLRTHLFECDLLAVIKKTWAAVGPAFAQYSDAELGNFGAVFAALIIDPKFYQKAARGEVEPMFEDSGEVV